MAVPYGAAIIRYKQNARQKKRGLTLVRPVSC